MTEAIEQNPVGRPTDYRPEMAEQAEKLCRLGATNEEMADFFGVAVSTIHEWRGVHPEFSDAVKKGKILADAEVANSLYLKALGSRDYPADTAACIFWLKNRQPAKWRDKTATEHSGRVAMSHEQWLDELDRDDDAEGEGAGPPAAG